MIGTILGGLVIGGLISNYIKDRREEREKEETKALFSIADTTQRNIEYRPVQPRVVTKTVVKRVSDPLITKKVEFFDTYRDLDVRLARYIGRGQKGVAYLINGLKTKRQNYDMMNRLKEVRNYRNKLSHDKRKWRYIEAPSNYVMRSLRYVCEWASENERQAANFVAAGKADFDKRDRHNGRR